MPVNYATPARRPTLHPVAGVRLGVTEAGIRKANRRDLTLIELAPGSRVGRRVHAEPLLRRTGAGLQQHLAAGDIRALVINTGIANAGTGEAGLHAARLTCAGGGHACSASGADQVLPFSTGVIMEPLPVERLQAGLPACQAALQGRRLVRSRARHHDHRHRRQGASRHRSASADRRSPSPASPRAPA